MMGSWLTRLLRSRFKVPGNWWHKRNTSSLYGFADAILLIIVCSILLPPVVRMGYVMTGGTARTETDNVVNFVAYEQILCFMLLSVTFMGRARTL